MLGQERLGTPASLGLQQGLAGQEEASRSTEMLLSGLGDGPGEGQGEEAPGCRRSGALKQQHVGGSWLLGCAWCAQSPGFSPQLPINGAQWHISTMSAQTWS